jgi:hypothetical protein
MTKDRTKIPEGSMVRGDKVYVKNKMIFNAQQQINRSPDLKRLRDEGFEIEVKGGYLIVHHIPYVNSNREVKFGKLISTLSLNNDVTVKPDNHVI